ncbi:sensor domain-containing protein [Geothrix alkalitolerans]|uniref:sensor domain-containing protein n=1 Tax=Geothrix alkalitolerans TaxID=2922724 RepID=UPI001FB01606|nr:sensor domain-containing protein [Geothrix alkalitolerans]
MPLQSPPHPGFFEVLATRQAYTTVLYLLLSLVTGILAFTYAVTGLSLSLGLAILIIGVPVAVAFLAGARLLSVAELGLLGALVGGGAPEAPALLPAGEGWLARTKALVGDPRTWTSLLYFVLLMPLGIAYVTLLVTLLTTSLALLAVPVLRLLQVGGSFTGDVGGVVWISAHPGLAVALCGLAGLALLPLTLHLALLLGRFQIWLARHLLVRP